MRKYPKRILTIASIVLVNLCVTSCGKAADADSIQGVTPVYSEGTEAAPDASADADTASSYFVGISVSGGTGKATIESPVKITEADGKLTAKLVWTSKNYDYMIVDGVRYEDENPDGASTFTVAIDNVTDPLTVIADTTAMSKPHEIEYVITWGEITGSDAGAEIGANKSGSTNRAAVEQALSDAGLTVTDTVPLQYASGFTIDRYEGIDYVCVPNSGDYLVISEGGTVPDGLPDSVVIIKRPLTHAYLVSTSAMDLINTCGALGDIRLSGTNAGDWYIDDARAAMENGQILYAGKYRAPDYELLLENECDLAIENTMIYHEPAVKEKLTELGIPVFVETSSYETHPLGRLEWIKLYGVLFGKEAEATRYFDEQIGKIGPMLKEQQDSGKTVAFFHVAANGMINVRKNGDYITKMITLSGGHYVPENTGESDNALSTMNMQMEDFYMGAADADILIYNSTIGGEIKSVAELMDKNPLFRDFKAVKEGQVYCTSRDLFQQITGMAEFMQDLSDVLNGTGQNYTYLNKLE